mgnify:CR=1 FL=1
MIQDPVIIVGCPRSGTTLLYNVLSEAAPLWSIGTESKELIERYHHPREKGWESGALGAADLTPASRAFLLSAFQLRAAPGTFWRRLNRARAALRHNRLWQAFKQRGRAAGSGGAVAAGALDQGLYTVQRLIQLQNRLRPPQTPIRLLEKTPENCLRLPFLLALFPDARIIYLTRGGPGNVNSLMEGWRQPHLFPGYRVPEPVRIPGDTRGRWAFTLIPGWQDLLDRPLAEVCAWQWIRCNEAVLAHRETGGTPYLTVRYEDLVAEPAVVLRQIATFAGIDYEQSLARFAQQLPRINVVSAPGQEKWRRQNPEAIARILPLMAPTMDRLGYPLPSL